MNGRATHSYLPDYIIKLRLSDGSEVHVILEVKGLQDEQDRAKRAAGLISLMTGAGGLDIGAEKAGFEVRLCIEIDQVRVKTLRPRGARVSHTQSQRSGS